MVCPAMVEQEIDGRQELAEGDFEGC